MLPMLAPIAATVGRGLLTGAAENAGGEVINRVLGGGNDKAQETNKAANPLNGVASNETSKVNY